MSKLTVGLLIPILLVGTATVCIGIPILVNQCLLKNEVKSQGTTLNKINLLLNGDEKSKKEIGGEKKNEYERKEIKVNLIVARDKLNKAKEKFDRVKGGADSMLELAKLLGTIKGGSRNLALSLDEYRFPFFVGNNSVPLGGQNGGGVGDVEELFKKCEDAAARAGKDISLKKITAGEFWSKIANVKPLGWLKSVPKDAAKVLQLQIENKAKSELKSAQKIVEKEQAEIDALEKQLNETV